ncbi:tetratricopeptide repeat protein [Winogradskyella sp. R77965]|uniref:tetratricopeptide repeat protein n=1 Tax=Winogradskyella sp. R77965 TaxID=3093872 RepID=UPI0037DD4EE1
MKTFIKLGFIAILITTSIHSQQSQKLDSLLQTIKNQANDTLKVKNLQEVFKSYLYNNPKLALEYAEKGLKLSKKLNYKKGIARNYYNLGVYYSNTRQKDSTLTNYNKAAGIYEELKSSEGKILVNSGLAIFELDRGNFDKALSITDELITMLTTTVSDSSALAHAYGFKGSVNIQKGNYQIALNQILKQVKILEKLNNPIMLADAYNNLAGVELTNENFESSIDYNLKALPIYKAQNDTFYQAAVYNDLGMAYYSMGDFENAETNLNRSLQLSQQLNNINLEATVLANLGNTYTKKGDYNKALEFGTQSLELVQNIGRKNKIVESLNGLGMTYSAMGKEDKALEYYDKVVVLSDTIGNKFFLSLGYKERATSYALLNNYKFAYDNLKQHLIIKDSIYNDTKSQQIGELRTIYDTEKKEQQIQFQKNEIELLSTKNKVNNLQRLILGLGFAIALITAYAYYQRNKRNKLAKEKAEVDLEFKTKELTTHALHLAKKNEVLNDLKQKAKVLKQDANADPGYQMLIQTINFDLQDDANWKNFSKYFEEVHKGFNEKAQKQFPNITKNDLRLMALLKMNLSSKEIANILNISHAGIKKARQRLRKKMEIDSNTSLEATVIAI